MDRAARLLRGTLRVLPVDEAAPPRPAGIVLPTDRPLPEAGQAFTFHGFRFEVMRKGRNRVTALRITPTGNGPAEPPPAA